MKSPYSTVMGMALDLAKEAADNGDTPVGAVIIDANDTIIACARNHRHESFDPLSHAEIEVMRDAAKKRGTWNFDDCTLIVTMEPCPMCAGALVSAHMKRIVFGTWDEKMGALGSVWDIARDPHGGFSPEVYGGIREEECAEILSEFFRNKR